MVVAIASSVDFALVIGTPPTMIAPAMVYENIKALPPDEQQDFIWDKIIYANPTKPQETLRALDRYKPLVTFDNLTELHKIKRFAPIPRA